MAGDDLDGWLRTASTDESARSKIYDAFEKHVYAPLHRFDDKTGTRNVDAIFAKRNDSTARWAFRNQVDSHDDFEAELEVATVKLACSPGKLSQFFSPLASANDPLFWPLHNNWEKNWAYQRLLKHFNSTWTTHFSTIAPNADDDVVLTTTNKGWGFHDPLFPFGEGLVHGAAPPKGEKGVYTNAELVELFDPESDLLPYVWDDFGFSHCD